MRHVVVQYFEHVGAHGLLRDGVDGKHRATEGAIINIRYSIASMSIFVSNAKFWLIRTYPLDQGSLWL